MKQIELTDAQHEKLIDILVDARDMGVLVLVDGKVQNWQRLLLRLNLGKRRSEK